MSYFVASYCEPRLLTWKQSSNIFLNMQKYEVLPALEIGVGPFSWMFLGEETSALETLGMLIVFCVS